MSVNTFCFSHLFLYGWIKMNAENVFYTYMMLIKCKVCVKMSKEEFHFRILNCPNHNIFYSTEYLISKYMLCFPSD
jgi:hypothetical protein